MAYYGRELEDLGRYRATSVGEDVGQFKTPSLRGVGYTLPYGHGGSYWGLTSVVDAIRTGGLPADNPYSAGDLDPFLVEFDEALIPALVQFLSALQMVPVDGTAPPEP